MLNEYLMYFLYYLGTINLIAALVFYNDKLKARRGKYRTKESWLHLFEMFGGVFIILPMQYIIRHKNRKFSYFIWTYLIFIVWIVLLVFVFNLVWS